MNTRRRSISYWSLLRDSLQARWLAVVAVLSFVVGLLMWIVAKDHPIPAWVAVVVGVVLFFVVVFHIDALRIAAKQLALSSISIQHAMESHPDYPGCDCVCVIETDAPLSRDTVLSLHFIKDRYEYRLGVGVIRKLQEGGTALVSVHCTRKEDKTVSAFLESLRSGNTDAIGALRISTEIVGQPETMNESRTDNLSLGALPNKQGSEGTK